jgi:hypothetical protein
LFNLPDRDAAGRPLRELAAELLRTQMWGVGVNEPHRTGLGPGDLTLIYLGPPERAFIGRAQLDSAVRDRTPSESEDYPGDLPSGGLLTQVEEWDPPVPMSAILPRVDPTESNPYIQANAKHGFRTGVVRVTVSEYETVVAVRVEDLPTSG